MMLEPDEEFMKNFAAFRRQAEIEMLRKFEYEQLRKDLKEAEELEGGHSFVQYIFIDPNGPAPAGYQTCRDCREEFKSFGWDTGAEPICPTCKEYKSW